MLVLSRKIDETIRIGDHIQLTVTKISGDRMRIGITAPLDIPIRRQECEPRTVSIEVESFQEQSHG